ncbi:MAG: 30S ribosomal protein S8 [Verrucomicrobiota bacterium]|jgi:small subunit ribosomal protein S8
MHDPVSDLLTRIRNAGMARHSKVSVPHSRLKESVARILKSEGYVSEVTVEGTMPKHIVISLKYTGQTPVIVGLRQISTPGLRRYVRSTEIPRVLGGMGISVVSTPQGVMTGTNAKKANLGGELVCYVW